MRIHEADSVKTVSILGATGSIGASAADVIAANPALFRVDAVSAGADAEKLAEVAIRLNARRAILVDEAGEARLAELLAGRGIEVSSGRAALAHAVAPGTDITLSAITGLAGLEPLLHAIRNSRAVAIANKEPLVAAGALVMAEAARHGCRILPVDSEHNAVFQVFDFERPEGVERIILTASGGPFLRWSVAETARATPVQALKHPTWSMGRKISIDSATMMNKALEIIEAHVLFGLPPEKIDVLIHPQSVVHSMVEYKDGSILSQMGASDMRTPIAHVLGWPGRIDSPGRRLDLAAMGPLSFEAPDHERFPALGMAYECIRRGAGACIAFNAANEVAVELFLKNELDFPDIMRIIAYALECAGDGGPFGSAGEIAAADAAVRRAVLDYITAGGLNRPAAATRG